MATLFIFIYLANTPATAVLLFFGGIITLPVQGISKELLIECSYPLNTGIASGLADRQQGRHRARPWSRARWTRRNPGIFLAKNSLFDPGEKPGVFSPL